MILLNGEPVNPTLFPDQTSQVWHIDTPLIHAPAEIVWDFQAEAEFLHLAQLKRLIDKGGWKSNLTITYLPYARQDKCVHNDATFALFAFAPLLNSLKFDKVTIIDPHSKVATLLINNSRAEYPTKRVKELMETLDIMCFPDAGAKSKYRQMYGENFIYGEKVRNPSDGRIIQYDLKGDPRGKRVLIVDDICDGGATFILLANSLYGNGAKEVYLFVTHGLFSKGLTPLFNAKIHRIFTRKGEMKGLHGDIVCKPYAN